MAGVIRGKTGARTSAPSKGATLSGAAPSPVTLIAGEESVLSSRALTEILDAAIPEDARAFNLDVFQGEDADGPAIVAAAAAYPVMADRRAVVVRSAERIRNAEPLLAYLKSPSPTTVLVLLSAKPDFRLKLFQALKAAGSVVECKTPYDSAIPAWIESEAARRGKSITPGAAALVHVAAGRSLTAIAAELEKLGVYVGDKPRIDEDDVRMVVGSTKEYTIFDLMNAVGRREEAPSLRILDRMLEQGESMTSCVVQLTKYFQKLWVLGAQGSGPADAAAKSLGIHPYFLREYAEAARRHSRGAVERAFAALKEADVALKTSAGTPRTVMTLLIHALTA